MLHRIAPTVRAIASAGTAILLLGLLPQQPSSPPAAAGQPYVYTGTVHAVQPQTGSLDLITGVGYALRLVHIVTSPETQSVSRGAAILFSDIQPGDMLRADCHVTPTGLIADRIEKLPPPSGGGS